jgi:hypothetical protein
MCFASDMTHLSPFDSMPLLVSPNLLVDEAAQDMLDSASIAARFFRFQAIETQLNDGLIDHVREVLLRA